jgi:hypothetical protein
MIGPSSGDLFFVFSRLIILPLPRTLEDARLLCGKDWVVWHVTDWTDSDVSVRRQCLLYLLGQFR